MFKALVNEASITQIRNTTVLCSSFINFMGVDVEIERYPITFQGGMSCIQATESSA